MSFNDTKNDPEWAWRRPVIAYHAAKALRGVIKPRILEIGCNTGENLEACRDLMLDARLYGLDLKPYTVPPGVDFVCTTAKAYFAGPPWRGFASELQFEFAQGGCFDLVLVPWIYIHTVRELFAEWRQFQVHTRRFLTFENEEYIQSEYKMPTPDVCFNAKACAHVETFRVLDGTPQTLRIFE